MLSDTLWQANQDMAQACLAHPFVQAIADGSLDREAFKRYMAQDAFFLRAFLQAYALAAARSSDLRQVRALYELMGGVLDELKLHANYAVRLGIDLDDITPLPVTRSYTDFLARVAFGEPVEVILAAMVPCMRLYAYLGSQLALKHDPHNPYSDWITTYASKEFAELTEKIESLLNRSGNRSKAVGEAYRYAMQCELSFFDAPLEAGS